MTEILNFCRRKKLSPQTNIHNDQAPWMTGAALYLTLPMILTRMPMIPTMMMTTKTKKLTLMEMLMTMNYPNSLISESLLEI